MKKFLVFALVLLSNAIQAIAADAPAIEVNQANFAKAKEVYKCKYAYSPITIDGIISDDAWKYAKPVDFHTPINMNTPIDKTRGWLLWDDNYIYVAFKSYDKDIWSLFTKRDSWAYQEDCLETFFWTDFSKGTYYNFEITVTGTIYDSFNRKRFGGGAEIRRWSAWNAENLKVATHTYGTLNNPYDKDKYVTMEVKIPFSDLPTLKGKSPKQGESWKFTLARCNYSVDLPIGHEETCSAPLTKFDLHYYYDYQTLLFVK